MDYQSVCGLTVLLLLLVVWLSYRRFPHTPRTQIQDSALSPIPQQDVYHAIEPIHDFDLATTAPVRLRPFKPAYHLTMGIENMALSDLIEMDQTYPERKLIRRALMDENPEATLQCNPVADDAVSELYSWMFAIYLPSRFPTVFQLSEKQPGCLLNAFSKETIELTPSTSSIAALKTLGEQIDTDFLVLLPRLETQTDVADDSAPIYHLEAFVACFPAGFRTESKLGLPLAAIHAPVPGYAAKLERSMDRFFARMPLGKVAARSNWSITTDDTLFIREGNHLHVGNSPEDFAAEVAAEKSKLSIADCRLRCERQTLFRLPKTKALVFAFKTYQYPLQEVKDTGDGLALADAIEGLAKGSVPEMAIYKRGIIWGEEVCRFLRT